MKSIRPLSDAEQSTLHEAYRNHPVFRVRQRAHALLLNSRGYKVARLCELFEVRHETVSSWLDAWDEVGITGLFDQARCGRPTIFNASEAECFLDYIDDNPHQLAVARARLQEETGKQASPDTFKRLLKKKTIAGNVAVSLPNTSETKRHFSGIAKS